MEPHQGARPLPGPADEAGRVLFSREPGTPTSDTCRVTVTEGGTGLLLTRGAPYVGGAVQASGHPPPQSAAPEPYQLQLSLINRCQQAGFPRIDFLTVQPAWSG